MLRTLLFLAATLITAPLAAADSPPRWAWAIPVAEVTSFDVVGDDYVVGTARGFALVHVSQIEIVNTPAGPVLAAPLNSEMSPHVLTTSYVDANGLAHEIVTDCAKQTVESCVERHARAVATFLKAFPKT